MAPDNTWKAQRRKEKFYVKAKENGFASRAAYKLKQVDEKFTFFNEHDRGWVMDLCCAPGSWIEYIVKAYPGMKVIGVDILRVNIASPNVIILRKNILDADFVDTIQAKASLTAPFLSYLLSDCAPKFTGTREVDIFRQHELAMRAVDLCKQLLVPGGSAMLKAFQGPNEDRLEMEDAMNRVFEEYTKTKPSASQKSSPEFYYLGFGKKISTN
jgi:23S rRNA (uridine2552-2'-O)-methyltransferase